MVLEADPPQVKKDAGPKAVFGEPVNIQIEPETEARLRGLDALIKQAQAIRDKWTISNCRSSSVPEDMKEVMDSAYSLQRVVNSSSTYRRQAKKSREDH